MIREKYNKKLKFSSFLPYGVASPAALALSVHQEETIARFNFNIASVVYDPNVPMIERVKIAEQVHHTKRRHVNKLVKTGYAVEKPIRFGKKDYETLNSFRPTISALFYLTATASEQEEIKRVKLMTEMNPNRKSRSATPSKNELDRIDTINELNDLAIGKDSTPDRAARYRDYLLESVRDYGFSPLALEPQLARKISMTPCERGKGLYRDMRLANIEVLFRENYFLTSLDRRHIATAKEENSDDTKKRDIKWFSRYVLHKWYEENPDFYVFYQEEPSTDPEEIAKWRTSPEFYSIKDFPQFSTMMENIRSKTETPQISELGSNNIVRHTCDGVAFGTHQTYIVHHTRPVETPWYPGIEENTILCVEAIIKKLANKQNFIGCERGIRNAIIVCSSVNHFAELFAKKPKKLPGQWNKEKLISYPYDNVNIVLLKESGVTQLRFLMLSNPIQYDVMVKRKLLTYEGFTDRPKSGKRRDDIFALSYERTPVFLAYSLNWQNLYWAKEKYDAGVKFYVCCYPEQVKYIQKIMPEVEFL